jgi:iron complex outermembrane receptor protein
MGSNGIHEGTLRYELGNPDLKAETSLQLDYSLGYNSEHVSADLDLFTNRIDNYIFLAKLQSVSGSDSLVDGNSVFKYTAGNATLAGGELTIDIHPHPLDWLHFENSFSLVNGVQKDQPDSSRFLPMIPAAKFTSDLKAASGSLGRHLKNSFVKIGVDYYFRQNHFYAAYGTETETPSYTLLNLSLGTDVHSNNKTLFTCIISAENLLDEAYQSHLSRLKYAPQNFASGRKGVYNMGRNIGFKVIIPFQISKARGL